jgi:RNA polymerase sigma-70 factor, ECF subfamily
MAFKAFPEFESYSDEQVLNRVLQGEVELYELLMRRYNRRLFRVTRSILRDDAEAEEVMQETYVRAYEHLSRFRGESTFATWLTRIAVHEALASAKRRGRAESLDEFRLDESSEMSISQPIPSPEQMTADREIKAALEKVIDALPVPCRAVFVLRHVEGLSVKETAECLELSEEATKMRDHRARALLRRSLKDRFGIVSGEIFPLDLSLCDRVVAGTFAWIRDQKT